MNNIITDIANAFIKAPDNTKESVGIAKAMSIYRDINAELEERSIRAITYYNEVMEETVEALRDDYKSEVKGRLFPFPDVQKYGIEIHLVEDDLIEVEFDATGGVTSIPVGWLITDSYKGAVDDAVGKKVKGAIDLADRRKAKKREALEGQKAELEKKMAKIEKNLSDL